MRQVPFDLNNRAKSRFSLLLGVKMIAMIKKSSVTSMHFQPPILKALRILKYSLKYFEQIQDRVCEKTMGEPLVYRSVVFSLWSLLKALSQ